jgi:hypothetical protein
VAQQQQQGQQLPQTQQQQGRQLQGDEARLLLYGVVPQFPTSGMAAADAASAQAAAASEVRPCTLPMHSHIQLLMMSCLQNKLPAPRALELPGCYQARENFWPKHIAGKCAGLCLRAGCAGFVPEDCRLPPAVQHSLAI